MKECPLDYEMLDPDDWIRCGKGLREYLAYATQYPQEFSYMVAGAPWLADRLSRWFDLLNKRSGRVDDATERELARAWKATAP
jgi:hypothetical protein